MNEGIIRVDLKRMMTKIMSAVEFKTDPKVRQELLAAFEEDIKQVMSKYKKYEVFEDENVEEADFYNIAPNHIGGMGPITLPGVDNVGSGDIPASTGSAKDRYEDELEKRKKKNKKKKSVLEFEDFLKEHTQLKPFEPSRSKEEELGNGDYEKGPANDPDAEAKERMKALKKARGVVTFKEFRTL